MWVDKNREFIFAVVAAFALFTCGFIVGRITTSKCVVQYEMQQEIPHSTHNGNHTAKEWRKKIEQKRKKTKESQKAADEKRENSKKSAQNAAKRNGNE